jgi:hypothetical protein
MKSQLTNKTWKGMWVVFLDVNPIYFKAKYKQETISEICDLLNFNREPLKVAKYLPVLYPEDVQVLGMSNGKQTKLFQGHESHMVCYFALRQCYLYLSPT